MKKGIIIMAMSALVLLSACGKKTDSAQAQNSSLSEISETAVSENTAESDHSEITDKLPVVFASTDTLVDVAKAIGGDRIEVKDLMPGVVDAHHWEPTPQIMVELNGAKMLLLNGAGFEMWLEDLQANLEDGVVVVDTAKYIELLPSTGEEHHHEEEHEDDPDDKDAHDEHEQDHEEEEHDHGEWDPHYWLDPEEVQAQAKAVLEALVQIDPQGEEIFQKNFSQLSAKLESLDESFEKALDQYKGRAILVPHKAFSYLADAYDLHQISIEGILADGQPNAQRMAEIIEKAKESGIKAVFYDSYGSSKTAEQVAAEIGAKVLPIHTLESISEEDREKGKDYFSLMQENLEYLVQSFE